MLKWMSLHLKVMHLDTYYLRVDKSVIHKYVTIINILKFSVEYCHVIRNHSFYGDCLAA